MQPLLPFYMFRVTETSAVGGRESRFCSGDDSHRNYFFPMLWTETLCLEDAQEVPCTYGQRMVVDRGVF